MLTDRYIHARELPKTEMVRAAEHTTADMAAAADMADMAAGVLMPAPLAAAVTAMRSTQRSPVRQARMALLIMAAALSVLKCKTC